MQMRVFTCLRWRACPSSKDNRCEGRMRDSSVGRELQCWELYNLGLTLDRGRTHTLSIEALLYELTREGPLL